MHWVLHLAGLVLLAWHSSGYAINDADRSEYYDDYEHLNRNPTYYDEIEVYEDIHPLLQELYHLNEDELDEIMKLIATLQDDELYSEEEVIRPKRSKAHDAIEDSAEDKITTEHIVIPKDENQQTKEVQKVKNEGNNKTNEAAKAVVTKDPILKEASIGQEIKSMEGGIENIDVKKVNNEGKNKTNEVAKAVDTKDTILKETGIEKEIKEMKSLEHEIENIDEFLLKEEELINKEFKETESVEDLMENVNALLLLEEEFLAEKERGSAEKIDRSARNSEWIGPIYPDYPWCPNWYPPYPWDFYQGWQPYFNPYPMAFPVNYGGDFNPGTCDGVTKQYVPVKGKVTIAKTFNDCTWTLPASYSMPKAPGPCFYPDYDCSVPLYESFPSNEPFTANYDRSVRNCQTDNIINAPNTDQGTIPVSGKVTIAAHFPC